MKLLAKQETWVQDLGKPVIQRNVFMTEPGIMACAMLSSTEFEVRSKMVELIKENRRNPPKKPKMKKLKGMRKFKNPLLQWQASHWSQIIIWGTTFFEPQIIRAISCEELDMMKEDPYIFPPLPLHSTSVERAVRLVTQASSQVNLSYNCLPILYSPIKLRCMECRLDTNIS